ncbi:MAG: hypothetical protein ACI959_001546, partial [Limisphaerales bacterium]
VQFTKGADETSVSEYRIMAVRAADVASFNIHDANLLGTNRYVSVIPNGSDVDTFFTAINRDTRGVLIQSWKPYRVIVLSVAGGIANANSLSAPSGAVTLIPTAVIETDIIPDLEIDGCCHTDLSNSTLGEVDFDGDGIAEVKFETGSYTLTGGLELARVYVEGLDSTDLAMIPGFPCGSDSCDFQPIAFSDGDLIDAAVPFIPGGGFNVYQRTPAPGDTTLLGNWQDELDHLVGVRTIKSGLTYYGWIRIQTPEPHIAVIKAFAWNPFPDVPIIAGLSDIPSPADRATNLIASDTSDIGDGRDLRIRFKRASDESTVSEYRVMAVAIADVSAFGIHKANMMATDRYLSVLPTGADIDTRFSIISKDTRGDWIVDWRVYQLVTLSVAGGTANANAMSAPSNAVYLSPPGGMPSAGNIILQDIEDEGNGDDLGVVFEKATVELPILAYGLIAVKASVAATFNLSAATSLSADRIWVEGVTGSDITTRFNFASVDAQGDTIVNDISYVVFVLSFPNPEASLDPALSNPSLALTLRDMEVDILNVADVADLEDASDLEVTFTEVPFPLGLEEYQVYIVRDIDAANFDFTDVIGLSSNYYTSVIPDGSSIQSVRIDANQLEVFTSGEIFSGFDYRVFVVSDLDAPQFLNDAVSDPSAVVQISDGVGINILTEEAGFVWAFNSTCYYQLNQSFINSTYSIIDMQGRVLSSGLISSYSGTFNLPSQKGMYSVRIDNGVDQATFKVMSL